MPTLIIIGFSYRNLSSTIVDIYYAYSYYYRLGYQIYICSDIIEPINVADYLSLISSKAVDNQFIPFVQNIFYKLRYIVSDKDSLRNWLSSIKPIDHKLIIYYTGHGVEKHLVLPDQTHFSMIEFRNVIFTLNNHNDANILVIIDCCNPHGLFLPFKFNRETNIFEHNNNNFVQPKIIVIASSEPNMLSHATRLESPFTRFLFKYLTDQTNSYDIKSVCRYIDTNVMSYEKIESTQECTVYSSYPSLLVIWPWAIHNDKMNLQFNYLFNTLMINDH